MGPDQAVLWLLGFVATISVSLAGWALHSITSVTTHVSSLQTGHTTLEKGQLNLEASLRALVEQSNNTHERLTLTLTSMTTELALVRAQLNGAGGINHGMTGDVSRLRERQELLETTISSLQADMSHIISVLDRLNKAPAAKRVRRP
jgi:chromosome segregation ATPase